MLETAIYVDDLARARSFYEDVMGLRPMHADGRMVAYDAGPGSAFLVFRRGASNHRTVLPRGAIPAHDGQGPLHFAFAIDRAALPGWESHLADAGVTIEDRANWPRGGVSIYFRDPDGHLVELATPGLWPNDGG
jgi:catechol 2,3-dioxygenase-like lactoylglutathione lyase family enzyme